MYYMHALYVCICIHIAYVYFYWDISIFSPWNSMPCFVAYIFQSTNILEIFLCQPPFKLFWMDMSWMQPLRMYRALLLIGRVLSIFFFLLWSCRGHPCVWALLDMNECFSRTGSGKWKGTCLLISMATVKSHSEMAVHLILLQAEDGKTYSSILSLILGISR